MVLNWKKVIFQSTLITTLVHWELIKQGVGIGFMLKEIGETEPLVDRVLPDFPPFEVENWLVVHRELNTSRRLRTVFDFIANELG